MRDHVFSILLAFFAYSMLDLGKAFQKIGLGTMERSRATGTVIWLAASTATSTSSFLILYAVSLGSVLIVGSMAGTGLAAVTILSVLIMKEPVGRRELLGVACVMAAPFLLASAYQEPAATKLVTEHLLFFFATILVVFVVLIPIFRKRKMILGILLAGSAGTLGGFVILFQKISTSALGQASAFFHLSDSAPGTSKLSEFTRLPHLLHVFANPYAAAWIALSLLSTLVLQLSYRYGEAIRLIPSFNSAYIIIPILGGVLIFREPLHPLQWVGVLLILCGVSILTFRKKQLAVKPPSRTGY
jgi:drug/metabolite transporter (DMT)-like permease